MENITEMKSRLDELYQEYRNKKNAKLSAGKLQEISDLLLEMTRMESGGIDATANELARFPAIVSQRYFETLTKEKCFSVEMLDELLRQFMMKDRDASKTQYFIPKFAGAVAAVMKSGQEVVLSSGQLPILFSITAKYAVNKGIGAEKYEWILFASDGAVFRLDCSKLKESSLKNIWNATNKVLPQVKSAACKERFQEWAQKYGFIPQNTTVPVSEEPLANEAALPVQPMPEQKEIPVKNAGMTLDELHELLSSERNTILSEMSKTLSPLCTSVTAMQTEVAKLQSMKEENIQLNLKLSALEKQNDEQIKRLQDAEQVLSACRVEKEQLSEQLQGLETAKAELEEKLKDAYALNSRESSMEAQKIRSELTKAFAFLYEDWQEFENLDVSEENYESLQAIIKKTFRALERNGISFKGNNT